MIYKMTLKDSVDTMTFNLLETPIVDKDIEGAVDNVTLDGNQYTDYLYLKKQYIQKWAIMCPDEYDELRGFYTRQFEDGEVPSYRVYYGANVTRDYTFNGDYFQFNAEGIETGMTLSQLLGNAEQTTYSGKNLFHFPLNISTSLYGVAITASANASTFVLNGTSTATSAEVSQAMIGTSNPLKLKAGTYTCKITGLKQYTAQAERVYLAPTSAVGTPFVVLKPDNGWTGTFTLASDTDAVMYLILSNQSSHSNTEVALQIESGSTATAYEPYVGGTASPNPSYPQPISTVTGAQTVKITGKNLVEDTISGSSIDGIGRIRSNSDFDTQVAFVIEGETYTLSYTGEIVVGGYFATKPTMNSVSIDGTRIVNNDKTFVAQYTGYFTFRTNTGESNAQCELGSTATTYTPYQGQSSYEVNLGKNLCPDTSEGYWVGSAGTSAGRTANDSGVAIPVRPNTYYTVNTTTTQARYRCAWADATTTVGGASLTTALFFSADNTSGSHTGSSGSHKYLIINATDLSAIQLELGSTATSYAPYFTPIELAKIGTYQDRIYKDEGKWYIEKQVGKVVLNGSENWSLYPNKTHTFRVGAPHTITSAISDHFVSIPASQFDVNAGAYTTNTGIFIISYPSMADVASFKTWLASNPTTFYCAGAQWATTTEITDETLLLQLNFLASLYGGVNNISLVGTGAQGEMEVFIRDVMSVETDVVPEVPVRLTLTDDGVINACGCRRNVQLTMRETTE